MNAASDFWALIAIGALSITGLYLVFNGIVRLTRRNQERDWQTVRGRISDPGAHGVTGDLLPKATLEYSYEYAGVNYRSSRVRPLPRIGLVRSARERSRPIRNEFGAVVVYVNPRNPARSVLDPSQQPRPAIEMVLIGVVAMLVAWFIWIIQFASPT